MSKGVAYLPKMDGMEVKPGVTLIGEPTPVAGTNKLRALANVCGCLAVVELSIKFARVTEDADVKGRR